MRAERGFMPPPEPAKHETEKADPRDEWIRLEAGLNDTVRATKMFKDIYALIDENDDYESAVQQLKSFLSRRRNDAEKPAIIERAEAGREISEEGVKAMMHEIRMAMSTPERDLGNGATSEAYALRADPAVNDLMVCAKTVHDFSKYAEMMAVDTKRGTRPLNGKTMAEEMRILDDIRNLEVEGVRTPTPLFAFSDRNSGMEGYAMEQLDAVNLRRVKEKLMTEGRYDTLPENFNPDDFFRRLRAYVKELHSQGIAHNDLYLRNMMVDRKTGHPRVIDFGAAIRRDLDIHQETESFEDKARKDFLTIDEAENEVKKWLEEKAAKG